jgi:hypothetical protein
MRRIPTPGSTQPRRRWMPWPGGGRWGSRWSGASAGDRPALSEGGPCPGARAAGGRGPRRAVRAPHAVVVAAHPVRARARCRITLPGGAGPRAGPLWQEEVAEQVEAGGTVAVGGPQVGGVEPRQAAHLRQAGIGRQGARLAGTREQQVEAEILVGLAREGQRERDGAAGKTPEIAGEQSQGLEVAWAAGGRPRRERRRRGGQGCPSASHDRRVPGCALGARSRARGAAAQSAPPVDYGR